MSDKSETKRSLQETGVTGHFILRACDKQNQEIVSSPVETLRDAATCLDLFNNVSNSLNGTLRRMRLGRLYRRLDFRPLASSAPPIVLIGDFLNSVI